jgi:hypothetical protein
MRAGGPSGSHQEIAAGAGPSPPTARPQHTLGRSSASGAEVAPPLRQRSHRAQPQGHFATSNHGTDYLEAFRSSVSQGQALQTACRWSDSSAPLTAGGLAVAYAHDSRRALCSPIGSCPPISGGIAALRRTPFRLRLPGRSPEAFLLGVFFPKCRLLLRWLLLPNRPAAEILLPAPSIVPSPVGGVELLQAQDATETDGADPGGGRSDPGRRLSRDSHPARFSRRDPHRGDRQTRRRGRVLDSHLPSGVRLIAVVRRWALPRRLSRTSTAH